MIIPSERHWPTPSELERVNRRIVLSFMLHHLFSRLLGSGGQVVAFMDDHPTNNNAIMICFNDSETFRGRMFATGW
jgi:hypothetical protein